MQRVSGAKSLKTLLLASAVVAGVAGYGLGAGGINPVTPSYADAVKVEAPAAFSFADVVEAVSPAVVSVRVEASVEPASDDGRFGFERGGREFFERFFRDGPRGEFKPPRRGGPKYGQSQGSGFFVSEDGYLVTNNHVIDGGTTFTVVTNDGSEYEADLVGTDKRTDLAVLKVNSDAKFTYVDFSEARPRIGEWVVAVGNPFGLGGTVTAGIVSAHGRNIGATRYDDFIQIDAAVNKGNSGGPAFNLNGEVVGINTAIFSPSGGNVGIAFAIPAALADEVVNDLINNGSVTRGWLGVQIQPVTPEMSDALGIDLETGAIIADAQDASPAAKAGLKAGDIIAEVDKKPIKGPRDLAKIIAGYAPGSTVAVTIWRDGEQKQIDVELGTLENVGTDTKPHDVRPTKLKRLGLEVEPTDEGLVVTDVRPGSGAYKRGIQAGDVIVSVNGAEVSSIDDMRREMKSAKQAGRKGALLQLKRQNGMVFVPVPLGRG